MTNDRRCPKCGEQTLRTWDELTDDEREVVRRLPGSTAYNSSERQTRHRWCRRCWHEQTSHTEHA